jgi:cell division protein FtsL
LLLVILSGLRNGVKDLNKELSQIKKEIIKEQNVTKVLQSDFTNLSNSSRIRKIAKEKLGLQRTNSYQIKKLSDFYIN